MELKNNNAELILFLKNVGFDNYLKYLKIEQNYINKVKMINKEDFKKLINWCNEHSKK